MSSVGMQTFDLEALNWKSSTDRQSTMTMFWEVRYFARLLPWIQNSVSNVWYSDFAKPLEISKITPHPNGSYFRPILYFCYIFNKVTRFYVRFLHFNWFWKRFKDRTRPKFASLYRYQTSNPIFKAISQH